MQQLNHNFVWLTAAHYSRIDQLDLHVPSGFLYWINNSTYTYYRGIYRTKTDGSRYSGIVTSGIGIGGIQGLAVDWVAG